MIKILSDPLVGALPISHATLRLNVGKDTKCVTLGQIQMELYWV